MQDLPPGIEVDRVLKALSLRVRCYTILKRTAELPAKELVRFIQIGIELASIARLCYESARDRLLDSDEQTKYRYAAQGINVALKLP